jgi:DNA-binding CsgD family transcriptional regulator
MIHRQEKNLLDFLRALYSPRGSHDLVEFILTGIPRLVACHNRGLARYDPARRALLQMNLHTPFTSRAFVDAVRAGGDMAPESFWQMRPEAKHPIHVISRSLTRNQWEEHPMYRDMFRSEGIIDCLTLEFGDSARRFLFCLHRDRRGFHPAEITIIQRLAPHLDLAFHNSSLLETIIPGTSAAPGLVRHHHLQSPDSAATRDLILENITRWQSSLGHPLLTETSQLQSWISHACHALDRGASDSALQPFVIQGSHISLRFALLRHWAGSGLLLLENSIPHWNITPREREILLWVRAGKTDREIATILGVSHHTVKEHLRRIYRKTGARSRTAAAHFAA